MDENIQQWRIYSPTGVDVKYQNKMSLRMMNKSAPLFRKETFVESLVIDSYGDDIYQMQLGGEKVTVVAREKGQRTKMAEAFGDLEKGIFFKVSDANLKEAESRLVKTFG